jgi:hypothetical protein
MANKDKKEYNLGYVRVTMPNHPDMKNQPAVIKVGGENLEDILGGGTQQEENTETEQQNQEEE